MSRRPKQKPYFTDRTYAGRKKRTTLHATSQITGLQHSFQNLEGWEQHARDAETNGVARYRAQLLVAAPFNTYIDSAVLDRRHLNVKMRSPVFRFCNPKFGPLTIVGAISGGGRFNIGGAQMNREFPDLVQRGCLYVASSPECSLAEAALPHGAFRMYELKARREFILWDLKGVIGELDYPNLHDAVVESGGEKIWAYCKAPAVSQILVHKLRSLGGDGVVFESTKLPGHQNIGLFFDTDDEVSEGLEFREISMPS